MVSKSRPRVARPRPLWTTIFCTNVIKSIPAFSLTALWGSALGVGKLPFFKSSQAQVKSQSKQFGQVKPQVKSPGQNIDKSSLKSSRKVKIWSSQVARSTFLQVKPQVKLQGKRIGQVKPQVKSQGPKFGQIKPWVKSHDPKFCEIKPQIKPLVF